MRRLKLEHSIDYNKLQEASTHVSTQTYETHDCDLHRLISLMFRPSAYQLSAVEPFRLLVLRFGTAYQIMSPLLHPCQHFGAI